MIYPKRQIPKIIRGDGGRRKATGLIRENRVAEGKFGNPVYLMRRGKMRDILFKNLTTQDYHRRDIFLSQSFENKGVTTRTQKHFIYFIRDHAFLDTPEKLTAWLKKYSDKGPRLKNLSVLKSYDSKIGEEKFEVKIAGNLYVLHEQDIFTVDFTQIFKIDRSGQSLKGKE